MNMYLVVAAVLVVWGGVAASCSTSTRPNRFRRASHRPPAATFDLCHASPNSSVETATDAHYPGVPNRHGPNADMVTFCPECDTSSAVRHYRTERCTAITCWR